MKRILLISLLLILALSISFGQIAYKKGDQVGSFMFGIGSFVYTSDATSTVPPLSVAYDFGYNENISFGGLLSYTASKYEYNSSYYNYGYKDTWSYIVIAARGAYHYDLLHNSNIDTYAGLMLGYDIASFNETVTGSTPSYWSSPSSSNGGLLFSGYAGIRYYFSPNLGAQAEIGFGLALLNIGVAYKF